MRKPPYSILLTLPTQSNRLSALRLKPTVLIQVNRIHSTVLVLGPRAIYKHHLLHHALFIHTRLFCFEVLKKLWGIISQHVDLSIEIYNMPCACRLWLSFHSLSRYGTEAHMHIATCPDSPSSVPREWESVHELLERWDRGFKSAQNYIHTCTSCYVRPLTASLYAVG